MIKAVGLTAIGLVLVASACTESFESCLETHTCKPSQAGTDAGGEGGQAQGQGGALSVGGSTFPAAGADGGGSESIGGESGSGGIGGEAGSSGNAGAAGNGSSCPFVTCDCEENDTRPCGPEAAIGICRPGTQTCALGSWGDCVGAVEPEPRDCTSALDNDCDGKPDNTIDESCKCVPGTKEACGQHPGYDGNGPCKAGERTCMGSGSMGVWGECLGSVAPKATDRCDVVGNDDSCDGQVNGACTCLLGEKSPCLDVYGSKGVCSSITLTCSAAGKWPSSANCAPTKAEACLNDNKDEDCDGLVNEPEECECISGQKSTCSAIYGSKGVCSSIALTCSAAGKWPSAATCAPTQSEVCAGDGKDENCDGAVNDGCECVNGTSKVCGDCGEGTQTCTNGKYGACTATGTLNLGKGPKLLCVKAGTFNMGSDRGAYEQPIHPVTLPAFWIDETEVTAGQYKACNTAGICAAALSGDLCTYGAAPKTSHPINCVNQLEAATFCSWAGKRLPTEEEWEYAARGTDQRTYPWGNAAFTNQAAWKFAETVAVASFASGKSPFGLFDMAGNVREWTITNACAYPVSGPSMCLPVDNVVTRGGAFWGSTDITTTHRYPDDPDGISNAEFGFRCAKDK